MSRRPLKPVNLNLRLNMPSAGSKTRPSMSQTKIMAADPTDLCPTVGLNSPVTTLAMNMSELSTRRVTPKRRLSLNSTDTPPLEDGHPSIERAVSSASSIESGVFVDSPTLIDSPTLEQKKTIAFRRISSQPPPALRLDADSPTEFLDCMEVEQQCHSAPATATVPQPVVSANEGSSGSCTTRLSFFTEEGSSQDSGVCLDKDLGFKMPAPVSFARRKSRLIDICEEANSPLKYSPIKSPQKRTLSFCLGSSRNDNPEDDSPVQLKRSSVAGSDSDDGFLDFIDQEVSEITERIPEGISSLLNDPVLEEPRKPADTFTFENFSTPVSRKILPAKRCLWRSQSVDVSLKRIEPPEEMSSFSKRWKAEKSHDDSCIDDHEVDKMHLRRLHRSHSETAEMIMSAVHRLTEEPDLIADSSKPHILPMVNGKHQDLKSITPETLSQLMNGEYTDQVEQFHIIDCRYPYEFEGGHIENALNVYTRDSVVEEYLKNPKKPQDPNKRFILVFHCEFSSERGPSLYRFLRSKDRESNKECYPSLYYPEIYLLEGGYKAFFEHHKHLCEPQTYTPMLHKDYSEDLRKFRAKSKSWAGEKSGSRHGLRNLKF